MKPYALADLRAAFEALDGPRRRAVQLALCRHALAVWEVYLQGEGPVEYVDSVVGLYHCVDSALPRDALVSVEAGVDRAGVARRYLEPIAALQDDDLERPGQIELAFYAIYNLYRIQCPAQDSEESGLCRRAAVPGRSDGRDLHARRRPGRSGSWSRQCADGLRPRPDAGDGHGGRDGRDRRRPRPRPGPPHLRAAGLPALSGREVLQEAVAPRAAHLVLCWRQLTRIVSHAERARSSGSEDGMTRPIQIRVLTEPETVALTQNTNFNTLHPSRCPHCGNTQAFSRKVFWIGDVPKAEQDSDDTHGLIAYHLKQRHNIASVFFKTHRNRFYVDSARCEHCGSTQIEFDIELSDDLLAAAAKLSGKPPEELRREIEARAESIAQHDRTAQPKKRRSKR